MNKIHKIQTWLIKHTRDIVNMYYVEGHQKKALVYIPGGSNDNDNELIFNKNVFHNTSWKVQVTYIGKKYLHNI